MALYKQLTSAKDKQDFYKKYVKDNKFDWVQMEEGMRLPTARTKEEWRGG